MKKIVLIVFLILLAVSPAHAAKKVNGSWIVKTTLVSAYDGVNQNYKPGMNRIEKWKITGNKKAATLTTPSGQIGGTPVGKAWLFDQFYDTGYGIIIEMYIVAKRNNTQVMRGTIEARYYSAQFGYLLGKDAWAFKGRKKGRK